MKYKYILFDLDGTVSQSAEGIRASLEHSLSCLGVEPPDLDDYTKYIGPPLLDTFRNFLLEGARKDISNIQQFYTDKMLACNSAEQLALLRNAHFDLEWRKQ